MAKAADVPCPHPSLDEDLANYNGGICVLLVLGDSWLSKTNPSRIMILCVYIINLEPNS